MGYIYKITNKINNKIYIGQTVQSPNRRLQKHISDSKKIDTHLYRAFNKYGIDNFQLDIIEECKDSELDQQEKYWIKYFDSYNNGYNETLGGYGGTKINREQVISLWNQGYNVSKIAEILSCSCDRVRDILHDNNINTDELVNRIFRNYNNEFILELWNKHHSFKYITDNYDIGIEGLKRQLLECGISEEELYQNKINNLKQQMIKNRIKNESVVLQFDLDGNFIRKFNSIKEASLETKAQASSISKVCNNEYKSANGFLWCYESDVDKIKDKVKNKRKTNKKIVYQYDYNKNLINIHDSITSAAKAVSAKSASTISSLCNKGGGNGYGYYWSFEEIK